MSLRPCPERFGGVDPAAPAVCLSPVRPTPQMTYQMAGCSDTNSPKEPTKPGFSTWPSQLTSVAAKITPPAKSHLLAVACVARKNGQLPFGLPLNPKQGTLKDARIYQYSQHNQYSNVRKSACGFAEQLQANPAQTTDLAPARGASNLAHHSANPDIVPKQPLFQVMGELRHPRLWVFWRWRGPGNPGFHVTRHM